MSITRYSLKTDFFWNYNASLQDAKNDYSDLQHKAGQLKQMTKANK